MDWRDYCLKYHSISLSGLMQLFWIIKNANPDVFPDWHYSL